MAVDREAFRAGPSEVTKFSIVPSTSSKSPGRSRSQSSTCCCVDVIGSSLDGLSRRIRDAETGWVVCAIDGVSQATWRAPHMINRSSPKQY